MAIIDIRGHRPEANRNAAFSRHADFLAQVDRMMPGCTVRVGAWARPVHREAPGPQGSGRWLWGILFVVPKKSADRPRSGRGRLFPTHQSDLSKPGHARIPRVCAAVKVATRGQGRIGRRCSPETAAKVRCQGIEKWQRHECQ